MIKFKTLANNFAEFFCLFTLLYDRVMIKKKQRSAVKIARQADEMRENYEEKLKMLEKENVDPQDLWRHTGFVRGSDGVVRQDVFYGDARIKLWDNYDYENYAKSYQKSVLHDLELLKTELAYSLSPNAKLFQDDYFLDFSDAITLTASASRWNKPSRWTRQWSGSGHSGRENPAYSAHCPPPSSPP